MKQPTDKLQLNLLQMVLVIIGVIVAIVYVTAALASQDPIWFQGGFDAKPARIIVYHTGQQTELTAGQPGFAQLAEAVRASLAQGVARPSGIGLSLGSLQDAYTQFVTVEAFFDPPVKLHTWFDTGWPTQMLFPITGRHSELNVVFLGNKGTYMAGAPALKTIEPIREALRALGFPTS